MIQPVRAKIFRDKCSSTCFITSRFSFASRSPYRIASFHICVIRRRSNQRPVSALSRKSLQNSAWGIDGVQRSAPGVNHWARWQPVAKFKRSSIALRVRNPIKTGSVLSPPQTVFAVELKRKWDFDDRWLPSTCDDDAQIQPSSDDSW